MLRLKLRVFVAGSSVGTVDPRMSVLIINGLCWRGEAWIGKRTNADSNEVRLALRLPKNGRAAIRTKVKSHRKAAIGLT
jgi:hypothetical protein